ncbi:LLM class flavin-dependent oxidoreductase [Williamsia sp. 1135]|uniref:LLM class flavin-dependent oxidoreductase n=1 Tax=Williamsia sp. 1135 TaxID=1889262 RepID=UPI000A0FE7A6|nr:LLM class flavin-dependent oxidoreductase [Williamsia sp. 1135]ORM32245.1 alkane 1-monooxygenase [Williamsia sp. 1135]
MSPVLSILDLAPISPGHNARESFAASVDLARAAERHGYKRVWYAEHHNMESIASSATSVLIAHIAAHTESIRLGAGGIMLPNHAPLTIAEQFGTLETLHPGRIDLGLGRAPGSDQATMRALRRDHSSADSFPQDVLELQGYLRDESRIPGIKAIPGAGTDVPLYILGSSLFGAQLAAALGLPYAFASHFSPDALQQAVTLYRRDFKPSRQLSEPYVIAGANAVAADDPEAAARDFEALRRIRVRMLISRGPSSPHYSDEEIDAFLTTREGQGIANMMKYTGVGTGADVREFLEDFAELAQADEVIVAHQSVTAEGRLKSLELTAEAMKTAKV